MVVLERYFWVIALAVCLYNFGGAALSAAAYAGLDAAQTERARRLRRRFALLSALPWLVMGYGQIVGGVPSVFHFFRPHDLNPYVLAFLVSIVLAAVAIAVWVLALGGARTAIELRLTVLPGMPPERQLSERQIALLAVAAPLFAMLWIAVAVLMDVPVPRAR